MQTPRRSYRVPETELARLREIQARFSDQTAALMFCINHTWATTTADGSQDFVWQSRGVVKQPDSVLNNGDAVKQEC